MFKYKSIHPSVRVRVFIVRGRARTGTFKTLSCSSKLDYIRVGSPAGGGVWAPDTTKTMGLSDYRIFFFYSLLFLLLYISYTLLLFFLFRFWLTRPAGVSVTTSPHTHTHSQYIIYYKVHTAVHYNMI